MGLAPPEGLEACSAGRSVLGIRLRRRRAVPLSPPRRTDPALPNPCSGGGGPGQPADRGPDLLRVHRLSGEGFAAMGWRRNAVARLAIACLATPPLGSRSPASQCAAARSDAQLGCPSTPPHFTGEEAAERAVQAGHPGRAGRPSGGGALGPARRLPSGRGLPARGVRATGVRADDGGGVWAAPVPDVGRRIAAHVARGFGTDAGRLGPAQQQQQGARRSQGGAGARGELGCVWWAAAAEGWREGRGRGRLAERRHGDDARGLCPDSAPTPAAAAAGVAVALPSPPLPSSIRPALYRRT